MRRTLMTLALATAITLATATIVLLAHSRPAGAQTGPFGRCGSIVFINGGADYVCAPTFTRYRWYPTGLYRR